MNNLPMMAQAMPFVKLYNQIHHYIVMIFIGIVAVFVVLLALYILYALFCEGMKFRRQYKETMDALQQQTRDRHTRLLKAQEEHDALYHQDKQTKTEAQEDSASS